MCHFLERLGAFIDRWFYSILGGMTIMIMVKVIVEIIPIIQRRQLVMLEAICLLVPFLLFMLLMLGIIQEVKRKLSDIQKKKGK